MGILSDTINVMDTNRMEIEELCNLNERFYAENAKTFSDSRQSPWPGWKRVCEGHIARNAGKIGHVIDVACGNMRFEKYLENKFGDSSFDAVGLDSCDALGSDRSTSQFVKCDVVRNVMEYGKLRDRVEDYLADLTVCFGFMHHVPTVDLRRKVLGALVDATRPGQTIAVSFWRFASMPKLLEKANQDTREALVLYPGIVLQENDYLLGWNKLEGVYRYCHSFEGDELGRLVDSVVDCAELVDDFESDGRNNALNRYLVFKKR